MSTLYLGTDAEALADRLADDLAEAAGDFFTPTTIVVPNRVVMKWLKLRLARRHGIAVNLRFLYLETALWELLRGVDPRAHDTPTELVDAESYRLLVLSVLLEQESPELAPLRQYLLRDGQEPGRAYWRKAWQLADRLSRLIRDYEYHRQGELIQPWLKKKLGDPRGGPARTALEKSQREVFLHIIREPDGKRARLGRAADKVFKTLPQYAMEMMELLPAATPPMPRQAPVYLFGLGAISSLHMHTLRWLGERCDLRLYHLNPAAGRRAAVVEEDEGAPAATLWTAWGHAGRESLRLMDQMCERKGFQSWQVDCEREAQRDRPPTVLTRLQHHLLGRAREDGERSPQDTSLQIVACPGIEREVETVYHSILHNLQSDPTLQQTDIAVVATDMARYRPVVQAVFEREPRRLHFNLADYSAAGASVFGAAMLGMLDLALEAFTRPRVFGVLLNPCVLARLGVDRDQARTWLTWAENLGIYHGWDADDKAERGYAGTPFFAWRLGLQRLRLGRLMESPAEHREGAARHYRRVLPYSDIASGDKEQLDAFCRAVEGLLPALRRLRTLRGTGRQWAGEIQRLVSDHLAIPEDRPEEAAVRDQLLAALDQLHALDDVSDQPPALPLALVREFLHDKLEALEGAKGELLTGGVTVGTLASLRGLPFRVICVLGLGEALFPGADALADFDLRAHDHRTGDIRPAQANRFLLLETLLAARDKIYLLYTYRDLQKDQPLEPCLPLVLLQKYLQDHVLSQPFETAHVPLSGTDVRYLTHAADGFSDVMVNYDIAERALAAAEGRRRGEVMIEGKAGRELDRRLAHMLPDFGVAAGGDFIATAGASAAMSASQGDVATVTLVDLKRMLICPAEAALRRHLRVRDDEEAEQPEDEPFTTDRGAGNRLLVMALEGFVDHALRAGVDQAVAEWPSRFGDLYGEWRLRCRVPEGAFADVDRSALSRALRERISGDGGLDGFLRRRAGQPFAGPVLLGESWTPVNARTRFPAVTLTLAPEDGLFGPARVRLVGHWSRVWRGDGKLEMLVVSTSKEKNVPKDDLSRLLLEPLLFWLALKAGDDPGATGSARDAGSSREWIDGLDLHIHLSYDTGTHQIIYPGKDIAAHEAREYLARLAADFLDTTSFDLLPFDVIVGDQYLKQAYVAGDEHELPASDDYQEKLREAWDESREKTDYGPHFMELLDVIEPRVPADALAKVRRRLALLDRGPARLRKPARLHKPQGNK